MLKKIILFLSLITYMLANYNPSPIYFTQEEENFIKNNPIINVGTETNCAPFDFVEDGKYKGFAKDYLDLIEEKSTLKFNYISDTWENLLTKAKNKEIDMLPCLAKSPKRKEFLLFTEAYLTTRDFLFTKDDNNTIKTIDDIKEKRIVIIKGYPQEEIFKRDYPSVKIYYVNNFFDAIDAVITNKADFFIACNAMMNYYTKKHNITNLIRKFNFGIRFVILCFFV